MNGNKAVGGPERAAAARPNAVAPEGTRTIRRHLVLVHTPGWQSAADFQAIARHARDIDPALEAFVVRSDLPNSYSRRRAATRPTLVFSPGRLTGFRPLRGKVFQGGPIPKLEQLRRLEAADVPVPRTVLLEPGTRLDPDEWGEFVVVKPTDLATSSHGSGIQLMRTRRVRFRAPEAYPAGHPGRRAPMMVQQFIDTGDRISLYRVLTLFGEPLYANRYGSAKSTNDLGGSDEAIEASIIASNGLPTSESEFVQPNDVLELARKAHWAIPQVPLKGCDIIRDATTGALFVLELNPGGNTWHFSSHYLARERAGRPPEHEVMRVRQFDAFRMAARVLVRQTELEAE